MAMPSMHSHIYPIWTRDLEQGWQHFPHLTFWQSRLRTVILLLFVPEIIRCDKHQTLLSTHAQCVIDMLRSDPASVAEFDRHLVVDVEPLSTFTNKFGIGRRGTECIMKLKQDDPEATSLMSRKQCHVESSPHTCNKLFSQLFQ